MILAKRMGYDGETCQENGFSMDKKELFLGAFLLACILLVGVSKIKNQSHAAAFDLAALETAASQRQALQNTFISNLSTGEKPIKIQLMAWQQRVADCRMQYTNPVVAGGGAYSRLLAVNGKLQLLKKAAEGQSHSNNEEEMVRMLEEFCVEMDLNKIASLQPEKAEKVATLLVKANYAVPSPYVSSPTRLTKEAKRVRQIIHSEPITAAPQSSASLHSSIDRL